MNGQVAQVGDSFGGQLPERLSKPVIQELSRPNLPLMLAHILLEWVAIGAAILLCERFWHPALYVVTVAYLGARQHGLSILMHEGVHYRICKSKPWNDAIAEVLCAWPVFLPMREFRKSHFAHHRHINTAQDPDFVRKQTPAWDFPKTRSQVLRMLLLDAIGVNGWTVIAMIVQLSRWEKHDEPQARRKEALYHLARFTFYAFAFAALVWAGALKQFALYWVVPLLTWYVMVMHIRMIAEHFAVARDHFYSHTRTVVPTLFDRLFLVPKNICYHIEHHFYPSVPFFRLPQLHDLMLKDPTFKRHAHVTHSYSTAIKEFCGAKRVALRD